MQTNSLTSHLTKGQFAIFEIGLYSNEDPHTIVEQKAASFAEKKLVEILDWETTSDPKTSVEKAVNHIVKDAQEIKGFYFAQLISEKLGKLIKRFRKTK